VEDTDRTIVRLLAADGRMSFTDLGKATGLSTSAVHQRVKRLEQRGIVKGYAARLDGAEIGLPMSAFISLFPINPAEPDDYPKRLEHLSEDGERIAVIGVCQPGISIYTDLTSRNCWKSLGGTSSVFRPIL